MESKATAMNAMPASTSFPPLIHQTIKAIIAAGNMKKKVFTMMIMMIIPNMRSPNRASQPIGPDEPKNSDVGNIGLNVAHCR